MNYSSSREFCIFLKNSLPLTSVSTRESSPSVIMTVENSIMTISRAIFISTIAMAEKNSNIPALINREIRLERGISSLLKAFKLAFSADGAINHPTPKITRAIISRGKNRTPLPSKSDRIVNFRCSGRYSERSKKQ